MFFMLVCLMKCRMLVILNLCFSIGLLLFDEFLNWGCFCVLRLFVMMRLMGMLVVMIF